MSQVLISTILLTDIHQAQISTKVIILPTLRDTTKSTTSSRIDLDRDQARRHQRDRLQKEDTESTRYIVVQMPKVVVDTVAADRHQAITVATAAATSPQLLPAVAGDTVNKVATIRRVVAINVA